MARMELKRSDPDASPDVVKHVLRLCRRARQHGLYDFDVPAVVDAAEPCQVRVGSRLLLVFPDGDYVSSLRGVHTLRGWITDRYALRAHRERYHAIFLKLAAEMRRVGLLKVARDDLRIAIEDRKGGCRGETQQIPAAL
jgi:hypothetical protein